MYYAIADNKSYPREGTTCFIGGDNICQLNDKTNNKVSSLEDLPTVRQGFRGGLRVCVKYCFVRNIERYC